jgi:catechol 2,3-dioxygenase-like lactoylglutathione lyase family enzyme
MRSQLSCDEFAAAGKSKDVNPLHTGGASHDHDDYRHPVDQPRDGAHRPLTTADADATHAELRAQGVDVDEQVSRMGDPVPPMFWFRDPEGHSLMIVESQR